MLAGCRLQVAEDFVEERARNGGETVT